MREKKRSFLFDRMLGKLCIKMRMLGYDAYVMAFGWASWAKGSGPGVRMQDAVKNANYPVVK